MLCEENQFFLNKGSKKSLDVIVSRRFSDQIYYGSSRGRVWQSLLGASQLYEITNTSEDEETSVSDELLLETHYEKICFSTMLFSETIQIIQWKVSNSKQCNYKIV